MEREFPVPFGGIDTVIWPGGDPIEFEAAVTHLLRGCGQGHAHNFAVETDAVPPRIYTTELGAQCALEGAKGGGQ